MQTSVLWLTIIGSLMSLMAEERWFPFAPSQDSDEASIIDASAWLDAPAGRHGAIGMKADGLVCADGTRIKFWGTNICNQRAGSDNEVAVAWAKKLAKYGVNCVRFHKFTYPDKGGIGSPEDSTRLVPDKWDNFDFFTNELKKRGIYSGWSHIYGHRITPADRPRVSAFDEIMKAGASTAGLVNFAPDLQDLSIALTVNLLTHRNPYTGLAYADDPSLAFIEMQNEDDIFFGATKKAIESCPTYKTMLSRQFYAWAMHRYATSEALVAAWGPKAFDQEDDLEAGLLYPICHPWWYGLEGLANQRDAGRERRTYDAAIFLYETQNAFYQRFEKAIRATGYKGVLIGSCWQAGSHISHYYNLHSDYLTGMIDRHNYFGGGTGHRLARNGKVNNAAMVSRPGSGLLGTGMQQVADRPFSLSEWMGMIPNEWVAEGGPIVAAYGLGLQGWDASFSFGSNYPEFTPTVEAPWVYNVDSPTQMGLYPALARMVYRGDVREGDVISTRQVHLPDLANGVIGFEEGVQQEGDVKAFSGTIPAEALAVGRVVIDFVDKATPTRDVSLDKAWDSTNKKITANTGQLSWDYSGKGCIDINTEGTQGVVGFAGAEEHALADCTLRVETDFAVILVTALERGKSLADSSSWLITAVGRAKNTGMEYSADRSILTEIGKAPLLLEAIRFSLQPRRQAQQATLHVLDHDGRRTDRTIPLGKGAYVIDGAASATMYYELHWD